ncbi:MAG TPA: tRNA pseudouridine(55) synthase TruB [Candidatus Polarisedimenticolia bacterium]|jgi:tRNA pseudouridine55 synthase|nr:tRNA pseudouridine(55) synthase TruB [Candidatus Polarisedimenticolia bacterium]
MNASGVLLIDKEEGVTSHDVVDRVRRIVGFQRVGHTGTLDPMATGLLPICLGKATRLSRFLTSSDKTYAGTIRFGQATDTHDREGRPLGPQRSVEFSREQLMVAVRSLSGPITQVPPIYSAKKHGGVPLYRFARRQLDVPRAPIQVVIHFLRVFEMEGSDLRFEVKSSPGTYIRVLVHDLGEMLGCGAHLHSLRRTACGDFQISGAVNLDLLAQKVREGQFPEILIPLERVPLGFGTVVANRQGLQAVKNGRALGVREILPSRSSLSPGPCRVENETGELVAIGRLSHPDGSDVPLIQPQIVFLQD